MFFPSLKLRRGIGKVTHICSWPQWAGVVVYSSLIDLSFIRHLYEVNTIILVFSKNGDWVHSVGMWQDLNCIWKDVLFLACFWEKNKNKQKLIILLPRILIFFFFLIHPASNFLHVELIAVSQNQLFFLFPYLQVCYSLRLLTAWQLSLTCVGYFQRAQLPELWYKIRMEWIAKIIKHLFCKAFSCGSWLFK